MTYSGSSIRVILLTVLCLFFGSVAHAFQCLVVSGINNDWNGAFEHSEFHGDVVIAGSKCQKFGSLGALKTHVMNPKNVAPGESLFITQQTHGDKGGTALCDNDGFSATSGETVIDILETFAQTHKVAFHSTSCYSADLLKKILMRQENPPELKRKQVQTAQSKLCVVAESNFGESKSGTRLLSEIVQSGKNPESMYLKQNRGLISSAAWSESGFISLINQKSNRELIQSSIGVLESLNRFATNSPSGNECMSNAICAGDNQEHVDRYLKDKGYFTYLSEFRPPSWGQIEYDVKLLEKWAKNFEEMSTTIVTSEFIKNRSAYKYAANRPSLWEHFEKKADCFKKAASEIHKKIGNFKRFNKAKSSERVPYNVVANLFYQINTSACPGDSDWQDPLFYSAENSYDRASFIETFPLAYAVFDMAYREGRTLPVVVDEVNAVVFNHDCSSVGEATAKGMLGDVKDDDQADGALEEFSKGSIYSKFKHPSDIARRNACRNFIFGQD